MNLDIYIENRRLDTDASTQLAITYAFADLTEPDKVVGDYSTTFTLKGTQTNNAVFGQIWSLDRTLYDDGSGLNVSVAFNPSKRANCVIYLNNAVFKRGYIQLEKITNKAGVIEYSVTFYSDTVDVLRRLKETKLRDLPFPSDLRHELNILNVHAAWTGDLGASGGFAGYLGYIMAHNGLYDDFDSDKWLTDDKTKSPTAKDRKTITEIAAGAQLDETAMRQYRSYYQRPALYLRPLIQLIAQQHGIVLDETFFNDTNPYYADSVMALAQYSTESQTQEDNGQAQYDADLSTIIVTRGADGTPTYDQPAYPSYKAIGSTSVFKATYSQTLDLSSLFGKQITPAVEYEIQITANLVNEHPHSQYITEETLSFYDGDGLYLFPTMQTTGNGDHTLTPTLDLSKKMPAHNFVKTGDKTGVAQWTYPYKGYAPSDNTWLPLRFVADAFNSTVEAQTATIVLNGANIGKYNKFPRYLSYSGLTPTFAMEYKSIEVGSYTIKVRPITKAPSAGGNLDNYYPYSGGFSDIDISLNSNKEIRSGYIVDKTDMLDDETTQGDFLIGYAKLFGLVFYTDADGIPHLVSRNTYFANAKIHDWTKKIDRSQTLEQEPIPFDARYLTMKYQDGGTFYEDYYDQHNGLKYGEQRIDTGYQFNEDETDLNESAIFGNTVMSRERTRILVGSVLKVEEDDKILPAYFEKENGERNPAESKYNLLFFNGMQTASQPIYMSDDTPDMLTLDNGGKFCWINPTNYPDIGVVGSALALFSEYPAYDTLHRSGKYSWDIGYPLESYAGITPNQYPRSATIFEQFWRKYIEEIYNVNNRTMTVSVQLSPVEVMQWSFADFVQIGNTLWHPYKIDQYNPLGNGIAKVELLKVSSTDAIETAYKGGQTDFTAYVYHTITLDLSRCAASIDNGTQVKDGELLSVIIESTENFGFTAEGVSVVMGGKDITAESVVISDDKSYISVAILSVTGNVTITATATEW